MIAIMMMMRIVIRIIRIINDNSNEDNMRIVITMIRIIKTIMMRKVYIIL